MATVNEDFKAKYGVSAPVLKSTVASGTAPLQVTSPTLVPNLNADLLDGLHASSFVTNVMTTLGDTTYGGAAGAFTRLPGQTTNGTYFLRENVTASAAVAPDWIGSTGSGNVVLTTSPTLTTPTIDSIVASGTSATTTIHSAVTTGSITIGAGLTTGALNLAAAGTGATVINIGHTNADINLTGATVDVVGTLSATSPAIATSITTASTNFDLINTVASGTVNFAGAAATVNIGNSSGTVVVAGNLTVNGTTTTINSVTLAVDDKNIVLGDVGSPDDTTADGGGITLRGTTDKTILWDNANDNWTFNQNVNIATGLAFKINNVAVLSGTTLGSTIVSSSLTSVGTITSGTWSGSFGAVSGANLTSLTAGNLSGTIPSAVLGNSSLFIGTTSIALNRASAAIALTGITSIDGSAASAGVATNLVGGNGTTLLGSMPYQSGTNTTTQLAPNVTSTKMFLNQTGTGTNGAAPVWAALVNADIPTALTGKTYNGLTLTSNATGFSIAGGTTSKTLTINNSFTLAGTDSQTYTFPAATATLAANNQTFFLGTTSIAINRTTAAQALTGITSIDGSAASLAMTNADVTSDTITVTANSTPTTLDSFAVATYRTAKYIIQMIQGTKVTSSEVMVMWDGTDVHIDEYSVLDATAGAANATITATHATGTMTVSVSSPDAATTNVVVKSAVTYIKA
jgi:trimeric autotransporter adhesin